MTAITLATASCSWLESLDKDPTADWSADKLYTEARAALEESNWTDAKDYYTKLEARYPFGTYAQQAQIELIYANWKDGDAAQAVQGADRFLQAYPNHANSDYVMYLKALATLNENDGWFAKLAAQDLAERDANAAQEAFDILKELALRFPDSAGGAAVPTVVMIDDVPRTAPPGLLGAGSESDEQEGGTNE